MSSRRRRVRGGGTAPAEVTPDVDAGAAESAERRGHNPAPVPAAPLATIAAGSTACRTIEINEAQPAERRTDDCTAALAGIDEARPAPLDGVATPSGVGRHRHGRAVARLGSGKQRAAGDIAATAR